MNFLSFFQKKPKLTKPVKGSKHERLSATKYYRNTPKAKLGDKKLITQPDGRRVFKYLSKRKNGSVFWSTVSPKKSQKKSVKSKKPVKSKRLVKSLKPFRIRKTPSKTPAKSKKVRRKSKMKKCETCQEALSRKIRLNMREMKENKTFRTPKQAIAVSYSQVSKERPGCRAVFSRRRNSRK